MVVAVVVLFSDGRCGGHRRLLSPNVLPFCSQLVVRALGLCVCSSLVCGFVMSGGELQHQPSLGMLTPEGFLLPT